MKDVLLNADALNLNKKKNDNITIDEVVANTNLLDLMFLKILIPVVLIKVCISLVGVRFAKGMVETKIIIKNAKYLIKVCVI